MGAESGVRRRVKGLSEGEFRQRFGTEAQCRAALFALRWGKGWACPGCGHGGYAELKGRAVYQCNRCKRQVGLTAGTVFHWTKLPLTTWFLAIYHLSQSKGGMSSVELARRLGTRQPTAWLLKHKLMAAMAAARGGEAQAGGPGRDRRRLSRRAAFRRQARPGAAGKTPFVAAVETTAERKPRRLGSPSSRASARRRSRRWPSATSPPAATWSATACPAGRRSSEAGCDHFPMVTGSGPKAAKWVPFTWVTPRSATSRRHSPAPTITSARSTPSATLTSFAWRFNRRYQLDTLTERLAYACARTAPHPYRVIIAG